MIPAKPKMLFVDDRSKRIHAALRQYGAVYDVTISPNVPETLRLLSSQDWDVVSLDFDLDGNDYLRPDSKACAMEIVRYLWDTGWPEKKRVPEFIIHSSNTFASNLLLQGILKVFNNHSRFHHAMVTLKPFQYEGEQ